MNIPALSMAMSQSRLAQNVSIQVLKIAKDQASQDGQSLVKMLDSSAVPHLGNRLDIRI
ncbi:YjfB family protein [Paenibacillus sp. Y412MC10]|uniref:YjfB family protein n=1 Tax=Geobacillus sp. (strain Y412MC10) TaxID=481743 RepID=UPI00119F1B13|nr:YjfB family protein [Paenibacillus sp. Y412MC10]